MLLAEVLTIFLDSITMITISQLYDQKVIYSFAWVVAYQHVDFYLAAWQLNIHTYRKTSNISRTLVGNKIVDHSDVVGASPVGAASSSFST